MHTMQSFNTSIHVEAHMSGQSISPQTLTWGQHKYTVIGVGRRWTEPDGVHILVEVHDNSRMEIVYEVDTGWRLVRYWPVEKIA